MRRGYVAIQIDAVAQADAALRGREADPEKTLGYLRIVSTRNRLAKLMGDSARIEPGDWLALTVDARTAGPRVWSLQLENDRYVGSPAGSGQPSTSRLESLERLSRAGDVGPFPAALGASVPAAVSTGKKLKTRYSLRGLAPTSTPGGLNHHLRALGRCLWSVTPRALDVGQASFNWIGTIRSFGAIYFDVGEPIWLHLGSAPASFKPPRPTLVLLSHWDSDHYAYGRQNRTFHDAVWIAPEQLSVGPNAYAFAKRLADLDRLILVGKGASRRGRRGARLIRCSGTSLNGSGLALHLRTKRGEILLSGDADYNEIPGIRKAQFAGIQIPHHGGRMGASCIVPKACAGGKAIASFGKENRYGHPVKATIRAHVAAGWSVAATAAWKGSARGSKLLL